MKEKNALCKLKLVLRSFTSIVKPSRSSQTGKFLQKVEQFSIPTMSDKSEPASKKRQYKNNELNFQQKLALIKDSETKGWTQRKLAQEHKISKSQVQRILSNKERIKTQKRTRNNLKRSRINREYMQCSSFLLNLRDGLIFV